MNTIVCQKDVSFNLLVNLEKMYGKVEYKASLFDNLEKMYGKIEYGFAEKTEISILFENNKIDKLKFTYVERNIINELADIYGEVPCEEYQSGNTIKNDDVSDKPVRIDVEEHREIPAETNIADIQLSPSEKKNRELMKLLEIPEDKNNRLICEQSQRGIEKYYNIVLYGQELKALNDFVEKNISIKSFNIIKRKISEYIEDIKSDYEKLQNGFNRNRADTEWNCSKKAVQSTVSNIREYLTGAIISPVIEKLSYNTESPEVISVFKDLIRHIVSYLKSAGFYSYNDAKAGEKNDEKFIKYFSEDIFADTSKENMNGKIKEVNYLPYITEYYMDDRKKTSVIYGSKTVYRKMR